VLADPLDIRGLEPGRIILATVGTAKAINVLYGLFVKLLLVFKYKVLVHPLEESLIILLPFPGAFFPIVQHVHPAKLP
jgi:hypothetical protein